MPVGILSAEWRTSAFSAALRSMHFAHLRQDIAVNVHHKPQPRTTHRASIDQ